MKLIFLALLFASVTFAHARQDETVLQNRSCEAVLSLSQARALIRSARDHYVSRYPKAGTFRLGTETAVIPRLKTHGQHVFVVGHEPEIFRALYDYPDAAHFHFLSTTSDVGDDYLAVIAYSQLHGLSQDGDLEYKEAGPNDKVWILRWGTAESGLRETWFHLHRTDPNDRSALKELLQSIPKGESLAGVMMDPDVVPKAGAVDLMVQAMDPGGSIVVHDVPSHAPTAYFPWTNFLAMAQRLGRVFSRTPALWRSLSRVPDLSTTIAPEDGSSPDASTLVFARPSRP